MSMTQPLAAVDQVQKHGSACATKTSAGGASSGRARMSGLYFRGSVDKAMPKLPEACCSGKHLKEVTIALNRVVSVKVVPHCFPHLRLKHSEITYAIDRVKYFPEKTVKYYGILEVFEESSTTTQ